jgi:hypothetical protein
VHAVLVALHPGWAGVQEGQELAGVQVPPRPFLGVVVDEQLPPARRSVLTVPVTALVAAGGGYEVISSTAEFGDRSPCGRDCSTICPGMVEVTGDGVVPGARVEVPAP